jgi:hypothetical protein
MCNNKTEKIIDIGNYNKNGEKAQPCTLPFLRDDLLPALKELVSYSETIKLAPEERHGLITRIEAMRDDLEDALNTGGHETRKGSSA